ncbi:hypothetical protein DITRI_Ditri07aG0000300 [Diplodiscus trichospermus]
MLHTIFIDQLSKRVSKRALWEIFELYGRVVYIFILVSSKRRNSRTNFAFVRDQQSYQEVLMGKRNNDAKGNQIDGKISTAGKVKSWTIVQKERIKSRKGDTWGRFIKVDHDTASKTRFDVARILISVESKLKIPTLVSIRNSDDIFKIVVSLDEDLEMEEINFNSKETLEAISGRDNEKLACSLDEKIARQLDVSKYGNL